MKNYNLDKLNNRIPSVGTPDKMGNLPKYTEEKYKPIKPKPSEREPSISSALSEAEKLMRT